MGRLDELMVNRPENFKTLTVRVSNDTADELKATAKELGVTRTRLVNEIFTHGYDELKERLGSNGHGECIDEDDE
jgi:predicted DNA-binding protein